ncbi:MAG: hypothetical protein DGJ47_000456 [Rickettsiaceae bacterium]
MEWIATIGLDAVIIVLFLMLTLIVGMGHGHKVKTIKDYALGGRNFSTGALIATIVATSASGSGFMVTLSKTYSGGFQYLFASIGMSISLVLVAYVCVPRMGEFLGKVSIAEAMGDLYGKNIRIITAIAGSLGASGIVAVQFKVFGNILSNFMHIPSYIAIITAGGIATIYSAFGGIRAVTFTDVLQFFAFGIVIPLISFVIWNQFYSEGYEIGKELLDPRYNINDIANSSGYSLFALFLYFAIPTMHPTDFQRVAIGRNISQIKKAFLIAAIFMIFVKITIAWIPFMIYTMNPTIEQGDLLAYIINNYSYPGLKGFIIVAIIAFSMSTADSKVNAASVLFTNDIYKVFYKDTEKEILVSRLFAFLLGGGAITLSLVEDDLLNIIILANSFYSPVVAPIFFFTILGFRSSTLSVLIAMSAGFIFTILWKIFPIHFDNASSSVIGFLLAMLTNIIFLFSSHYLLKQPGGWVGIKDKKYLIEQKEKKQIQKQKFFQDLQNFSLTGFFDKIAPRTDVTYMQIGVYFIVYTITTMYLTHVNLLNEGRHILSFIYPFMLITGTVMSMYYIWPLSVSRDVKETIIKIWWPIALFYMLIIFSGFFVLVSDFSLLQTSLAFVNIMVITILYRWRMSLVTLPIGFYLSIKLYQFVYGDYVIKFDLGSPELVVLYVIALSAISVILFVKPKEEYLEETEKKIGLLTVESKEKDKKIQYLNKEIQSNERCIGDLRDKILQRNNDLKKTKEILDHNNNEIEKLEKEVKIKERQYQELDNSSRYNMENARITQYSINDMKNKISELKENVSLREHHVRELQDDIEQSQDSIEKLSGEIKLGSKQVEKLKKQIQTREEKITKLTKQIKLKDCEVTDAHEQVLFFKEKYVVQEKEIARLNETSNRILNNVTHELRLPVGNVMNFAEMLSEQVDAMKDSHLKMLSDEVFQNSNRLSTMILNMLDLMTLNMKQVKLDKQTINIGEIIKERVDRCKKIYLDGKPIKFKLKIESDMLAHVDVHYMKQVIDNLVINAIKFSEQGTITVWSYKESGKIVINISDEGKGIPPLEIYDIFTPFKMASNSFSKAEGRGVGLALCKAAIEAHDGYIEVRSKDEIGAQFSIELPIE